MAQKLKTDKPASFEEKHEEVLQSIRMSRIILPVILGLGVVGYLMWQQFDPQEFANISWTTHTLFWILASISFLALRHLAYAWRLRVLSDQQFSWLKCIELIFIWEFSSAVSPTAVGGSAVAFFILSQEKLSAGKTATIVLYTVVLDTVFFILFLPPLIFFLGNVVIHPTLANGGWNAWGTSFWSFYGLMFSYGLIFYYGLFVNPEQMKRILVWFTKIRWLKKLRRQAVKMGDNMIVSSRDMKRQSWSYHLSAFTSTSIAWASRFILLNCLIIAFLPETSLGFYNQILLYARQKAMFVLIAFSPTPGGSGFVEMVFGGYLKDFVPLGISAIVAFAWRIITYYFYLLAGAIVIPNWINNLLRDRNRKRQLKSSSD